MEEETDEENEGEYDEVGMAHNDLKPAEFIRTADGKMHLVDFDLAIPTTGKIEIKNKKTGKTTSEYPALNYGIQCTIH